MLNEPEEVYFFLSNNKDTNWFFRVSKDCNVKKMRIFSQFNLLDIRYNSYHFITVSILADKMDGANREGIKCHNPFSIEYNRMKEVRRHSILFHNHRL